MTFSVFLRTRTTDNDYRWIGETPHPWWERGWGSSLLRVNNACLLRDGQGRLLLTGIQSGRQDLRQTRIRYEIALSPIVDSGGGGGSAFDLDEDDVRQLMHAWWSQRGTGHTGPWSLGVALDEALEWQARDHERGSVDALLDEGRAGIAAAVREAVRKVAPTLPKSYEPQGALPDALDWIGAENRFVLKVLLGGAPVAYFEGVTVAEYQGELHTPPDAVNVIDGTDAIGPKRLAPTTGPPTKRPSSRKKAMALAALAVAALVASFLLVRHLVKS